MSEVTYKYCVVCDYEFEDTPDCFAITASGELDDTCKKCREKLEWRRSLSEISQFEQERRHLKAKETIEKRLLEEAAKKKAVRRFQIPHPSNILPYHNPKVRTYLHGVNNLVNKRHSRFLGRIPIYELYMKMELQDWKCIYCENSITFDTCNLDHVYPLAKDGDHYLYNVAYTCKWCNFSKHSKTLPRFCKKQGFDYEYIVQKLTDINQILHNMVFVEIEEDEYL